MWKEEVLPEKKMMRMSHGRTGAGGRVRGGEKKKKGRRNEDVKKRKKEELKYGEKDT